MRSIVAEYALGRVKPLLFFRQLIILFWMRNPLIYKDFYCG